MAAAGMALAAAARKAKAESAVRYPLGIQLFALVGRDRPRTWEKYSRAIEIVGSIGYEFIEPAGLWGFDPQAIRKKAESSGLRVRSLHMGFDQMNDLPAETTMAEGREVVYATDNIVPITRATAPIARDLGCEWGVIATSATSSYKSADSIKRLCNAFNESSVIAKQAGLKFGYHMHAIDFQPVDGVQPYQLLIEQTDPQVRYELDVCWAEAGGVNPADFIRKYPKKLACFHLQDLTREKKVANPGDGVIDFKAIHEAARAIDNPMMLIDRDGLTGDARVEQAKTAFRYLQGLGWGKTV
ncbi:MAG: sugar phosphate isomerase/epimerase [Acidobacteriota bacterium]